MALTHTHKTRRNREAGFTLVEVLCVLALLGLTAGLVVLNLPKPAPPFEQEALGVTTTLNIAAQESVIDGKIRGVDFTTGKLEVLRYDGEWISEHESVFYDIASVELTVEQQEIDLVSRTRSKAKAEEDAEFPPLIYFDATGNVTPFTLFLNGSEESVSVSPNIRGRIIMEPVQ